MAGISQVLSIAKEALLTHQSAISVAGHNIANVNTPGYSRQTLDLTTPVPSISGVGFFGNGVRVEQVDRNYDRFMVKRLVDQESTLSNLEAQNESMRIVETVFNEAPGLAMNDMLSDFWAGWQDLATNPELISSRQMVVQQAELINEQFHIMAEEIANSRQDIASNLDASMDDVNSLTTQIAQLNVEITGSESDMKKQNDLRDQRDILTTELAGYLDINYFEMDSGSYTILLTDGHALVESDSSWDIKWKDNNVEWMSTNSEGTTVGSQIGTTYPLGGKIGGWLEVHQDLVEGDPTNYLGRLDSLANSFIREVNQAHTQGVGLISHSDALTSDELASRTTLLQSTIDATTATDSIPSGSLNINGTDIGEIRGSIATNGVAMGKAYNAAEAINNGLTDVKAKLTTQVQGSSMAPLLAGDTISFRIEGIDVTYTAAANETATVASAGVAAAINTAILNYNTATAPENTPKVLVDAVVGDGTNGGEINAIVLRNRQEGDESNIEISGIEEDPTVLPAYTMEQKLGLSNDTYVADASHNTGELSLFNRNGQIEIDAGANDVYLTQLGLGGGTTVTGSSQDSPGDGELIFTADDNSIANSINGYDYTDTLNLDGGSFDIWIYNSDDTLALPTPVSIPTDRAYTLEDIASAINISIINASEESTPWVEASVVDERLVLTPDSNHKFAFGGDDSNFLATAGLNTFFTGHSAASIDMNSLLSTNLEHLAAGQVNDYGEIFSGNELNVLAITNIQKMEDIQFIGSSSNTLDGHYNSLVAEIGLKSQTITNDYEYNTLVTGQLQEMRDSVSGVNLDEEMANLIKFQYAYSAAAKLITTSDEMFQTLLASVGV